MIPGAEAALDDNFGVAIFLSLLCCKSTSYDGISDGKWKLK